MFVVIQLWSLTGSMKLKRRASPAIHASYAKKPYLAITGAMKSYDQDTRLSCHRVIGGVPPSGTEPAGRICTDCPVTLPSLFVVPVTVIVVPTNRSFAEPVAVFITCVELLMRTILVLPSCILTVIPVASLEIIFLLIPQRLDRVKPRSSPCRVISKHDAYES